MDACERQQYIRTAPAHSRRSESTLDRLDWRDLRPRAAPMKIPDALERWRADAHEQDRKRRTATRHRHEQERADIMARAQAAATPSDIDQRIAAAVEAERERNYAVMVEAFAELQAMINKRIDAALAVADKVASQVEAAQTEIRRLNAGKADSRGVIRKELFTPGPLDLN